jgi:hypothetical protein
VVAAAVCAVAGIALGSLAAYVWSLPDEGTDGAAMMAMSLALASLVAIGVSVILAVQAAVHRYANGTRRPTPASDQ